MTKNNENLLIVDDHPDNLRVLASILNEEGYKVRKALSGAAALESARIQPPDLILLDINMPQIDGYEVCAALKAGEETREIPIIFLSGMDSVADKVKAFNVGGADYITKPFQAEEVLVRVRQQLTLQWQKQQLQQEIQERKQAQAETQLLLTIIQAVSEAINFEAALEAVLGEVRRAIAWDYGEAWIPNSQGTEFYLSNACYDSQDSQLQQFHKDSQEFTFASDVGLAGKIWESRQPEWIEDISLEKAPVFLRRDQASLSGLRSGFGLPIVLDKQVLAILIFLKRNYSQFDPKLIELVNAVALQLGGVFQRKQIEAALRQANQELQRLVNIDGLTQIANRRCFDEVLQQEWKRLRREQAPLSLILCDIDLFKRYNDYYGHLAGDDCLKQIARAIAQSGRQSTDLIARYGGEEFAILLPNTPIEEAICVAEQIQMMVTSLQIPHLSSQVSDSVTLSMGIACITPGLEDLPEQLIEASDRALYAAKHKGRNMYCIYGKF